MGFALCDSGHLGGDDSQPSTLELGDGLEAGRRNRTNALADVRLVVATASGLGTVDGFDRPTLRQKVPGRRRTRRRHARGIGGAKTQWTADICTLGEGAGGGPLSGRGWIAGAVNREAPGGIFGRRRDHLGLRSGRLADGAGHQRGGSGTH